MSLHARRGRASYEGRKAGRKEEKKVSFHSLSLRVGYENMARACNLRFSLMRYVEPHLSVHVVSLATSTLDKSSCQGKPYESGRREM